jgi:hypothetical protein
MKRQTYRAIKWGARLSLVSGLLLVLFVTGVVIHCRVTGMLPGELESLDSGLLLLYSPDGSRTILYLMPSGPKFQLNLRDYHLQMFP